MNDRTIFEKETKYFNMDITRHINQECLAFGICFNWNYKPSLEIDFAFWRFHIEKQ